jgi:hypothetical protein
MYLVGNDGVEAGGLQTKHQASRPREQLYSVQRSLWHQLGIQAIDQDVP